MAKVHKNVVKLYIYTANV